MSQFVGNPSFCKDAMTQTNFSMIQCVVFLQGIVEAYLPIPVTVEVNSIFAYFITLL